MKDKEKLEQLLNGYIDGELNEHQCNEVKRLIANDPDTAKLFNEIQRTRQIVGSMPLQHAPDELIDNVKADLERTALLSEYDQRKHKTLGVADLYGRKMISAAAMLALIAILAIIIYKVVTPAISNTEMVSLNTKWNPKQPVKTIAEPRTAPAGAAKTVVVEPPTADSQCMQMELELATSQYMALNDHISKNVIVANNMLDSSTIDRGSGYTSYTVACSRANVNKIIDGLEPVWSKITGSKLLMGPEGKPWEATVGGISLEQIMQIVTQRNQQEQIKLAKDFAMLNAVAISEPNAVPADANTSSAPKAIFADSVPNKPSPNVEQVKLVIKVIGTN